MVWQTLVSRAIEVLPGEGREVTLRRGTVHRLRSELLRHVEISHLTRETERDVNYMILKDLKIKLNEC